MTAVDTYYDKRWSSEDQSEKAPAVARVRIVGDAVQSVLSSRSGEVRVLDVGCGNGWILAELDRRFGDQVELYGIEPSGRGAENASKRVPSARIVAGTLATVAYAERFDLVVTSEVIEHVTEQGAFVDEIANVMLPGGSLVLTTPNGAFREGYFELNPYYDRQPIENWLKIAELKQLFLSRFDVRSVRTFNPEYFYGRHAMFSLARRTVQALPGGRYVRRRLDRFVWREMRAGLNILAVFDRKAQV